jgi:hypothetical protein
MFIGKNIFSEYLSSVKEKPTQWLLLLWTRVWLISMIEYLLTEQSMEILTHTGCAFRICNFYCKTYPANKVSIPETHPLPKVLASKVFISFWFSWLQIGWIIGGIILSSFDGLCAYGIPDIFVIKQYKFWILYGQLPVNLIAPLFAYSPEIAVNPTFTVGGSEDLRTT